MTTPIRNRAGRVCGWLAGDTIRDMSGNVTAFLAGTSVAGTRGQHLGQFLDGNFRDSGGRVVGWVNGARGGPVKPVAAVTPVQPVMAVTPVRPVTPITPVSPVASLAWSPMTWEQFMSQ